MFSQQWLAVATGIACVGLASVTGYAQKKNVGPQVSIKSPANGATYMAPATITITADATDSNGTVSKVDFLAGGSVIGTVTVAPYTFTWSNVSAGTYSLTARATDNQNRKTTSAAVNVTVNGAPPPDPKSVSGQWSSLINFPNPSGCSGCAFLPIHMHLMPNGKILMSQDDNASGPRGSGTDTVAYVWDLAANTFTSVPNLTLDVFCSGHALLPNGTIFLAGGHNGSDNNGTDTATTFDYTTNQWTVSGFHMNAGRWYPTVTALANGEMLVVSGNISTTLGVNTIPEVWQTNAGGGFRRLTSAPLSQPLYPWMHVAPNGKVFNSGPDPATRYLDTSGTGAWSSVATHIYSGSRDYGSSVMYDNGKVLVMGGGAPTNTAEIIDLNAASPAWQSVSPMAFARRQMSATILPDGKVLVFGGSSSGGFNDATQAVMPAEMWNPDTKAWTRMASIQVPRMYHSDALLLPDGRVISAGGGRPSATNTTDQPNAQIYSPPYLFNSDGTAAARPVISSAPAELLYGQGFSISTSNAASITQVTMIRLGSFTHSYDANQRINRLTFTTGTGVVNATAPASSNVCPPGHYMLFILSNGVPSVARIVHIQ